jgi:hypothetical protein
MDTTFWMLLALAATLLYATLHSRRMGNEGRDVALLAVIAGALGLGSVAAAVF